MDPASADRKSQPDDDRGGWWKAFLAALATVAAAVVAWGWLRPKPARLPDRLEETTLLEEPAGEAPRSIIEVGTPSTTPLVAIADRRPPAWVRPTIRWTLGLVIAILIAISLLGPLRKVITYVLLALFFSFALEPAVNYMHARWHWKRGAATALLLFVVMLLMLLVVLIFVPTVLKGASAIAARVSESSGEFSEWVSDTLGLDVETGSLESGATEASSSLEDSSKTPMSVIFGFTASLVGGIFGVFTVAMFIFYMVADAPHFKRSVLSLFPQRRQEELLSIWEAAIEKTGGYFYSRLLLATINGGLFFVMLRIVGVPGAAALAFFEGSVAAFIPIVGTYIAAIVPIVIAFISVGATGALVLLIYVLIYQQVENYLFAPKIQGRTMQLHPAVAFGAALAGGALGGLLWAFLALPFAATVQASASLWIQHHEVVESELTHLEVVTPQPEKAEGPSLLARGRAWLGSQRGWIRRKVRSAGDSPGSDDADDQREASTGEVAEDPTNGMEEQ
jgi:predicted PurR-regulated permease PerM